MSEPCVFCDRSQFEDRIIAETDDFHLIATLGQITDGGHVLLFPKRHVICVGAMEESELRKLSAFIHEKVRPAFETEYGGIGLIFEHGIVGQTVNHAHLQILPGEFGLSSRIDKDFPPRIFKREILFIYTATTSPLTDLGRSYRAKPKPYILWKDSSTTFQGSLTLCWNPPAPSQYLRIVAAEFFGRPERASWREADPELDKKLREETAKKLKKHF